jgi:hypothetical protein
MMIKCGPYIIKNISKPIINKIPGTSARRHKVNDPSSDLSIGTGEESQT